MKLAKDMVTYGLTLAQSTTSGVANVCPYSTLACRNGCVLTSGNGRYDSVKTARAVKTRFLMADPSAFYTVLADEIARAEKTHGDKLRIRLNVASDIRHEDVVPWLFARFPAVRFYDYTKDWGRNPPANYTLCRSASERTSDESVAETVAAGSNVAVVFSTRRGQALPSEWQGMAVIDGDRSDNRADDMPGVVIGLRAKGALRGDRFGMVRAV
jgi:hypothetical protein